MDKHTAEDLATFIWEHSQYINEQGVQVKRNAPRSRSYYVAAMCGTEVEGGVSWEMHYFTSRGEFVLSPWYDEHKPLRTSIAVARLVEAQAHHLYTQAVQAVVSGLHRTAAQVERHLSGLADPADRYSTPEKVAERVAHDVLWAVPNLHLEGLAPLAASLSEAREKTREAEARLHDAERLAGWVATATQE